jgi:hypothetical protein
VAGQSNGLGFGNSAPAPYTPTPRVQIWTDTDGDGLGDAWHYMLPGVNTGTAANPTVWGPEVAFANAWLADHPDGVLWIDKVTKGSVGLAQDPHALDWSPASRGEEFDIATASVTAAKAALAGTAHAFAGWDAALWMQGETDATDPVKAQAYEANARELIADARAAWNVGAFIIGRIGDGPALPFSHAVRDAEWDLDHGLAAVAGVQTFKTIGFETQADELHLDARGQLALGHAFYDSWLT